MARESRRHTAALFPAVEEPDRLVFETQAWNLGLERVAGVDEAGRGPLAGPVVAGAVIMWRGDPLVRAEDSKKVSPENRKSLFEYVLERAMGVGVGIAHVGEIDEVNILRASLKAMCRALDGMDHTPDMVLVDGDQPLPRRVLQKTVIKGDQRSMSIAAASLIAKVIRDRIMDRYHVLYPQYNFESNKGYGTQEHREAIARYGPCPIHRKTFKGVREFVAARSHTFFSGLIRS